MSHHKTKSECKCKCEAGERGRVARTTVSATSDMTEVGAFEADSSSPHSALALITAIRKEFLSPVTYNISVQY
jgi:hypothetical protein